MNPNWIVVQSKLNKVLSMYTNSLLFSALIIIKFSVINCWHKEWVEIPFFLFNINPTFPFCAILMIRKIILNYQSAKNSLQSLTNTFRCSSIRYGPSRSYGDGAKQRQYQINSFTTHAFLIRSNGKKIAY